MSALIGFFVARLAHFIRFSLSGLIATGINYVALLIFIGVVGGIAAATLAFALSTGANFVLQKFWTYRDWRSGVMRSQIMLYIFMGLIMLGLNDGTVWALTDYARLNWILAQVVATVVVSVVGLESTRRIFAPAVQRIQ